MKPSRPEILSALARLDALRRGSITEQTFVQKKSDGSTTTYGPYPLYSRKDARGKTVSQRLSDPAQIDLCREHIAAHDKFQQLTAELIKLGEARSDELIAAAGDLKKNSPPTSSPSSKKRK